MKANVRIMRLQNQESNLASGAPTPRSDGKRSMFSSIWAASMKPVRLLLSTISFQKTKNVHPLPLE